MDAEKLPYTGEAEFLGHLGATGVLSSEGIARAQAAQSKSGAPLCAVLVSLGLLEEPRLVSELSRVFGLPTFEMDVFDLPETSPINVNAAFLRTSKLLPLSEDESGIDFATANPFDRQSIKALELFTQKPIRLSVGPASLIEKGLDRILGTHETFSADDPSNGSSDSSTSIDIQRLMDLASEAPVVRLVNQIISDAIELGASDIHVEPMEGRLALRYRVDGDLRPVPSPPRNAAAAITSRIKIMAHLDIAERRLPQDGRLRFSVRGREIDFRVSTTPSQFGESIVLRVLDRAALKLDFASLGFRDAALDLWHELLTEPHGVILATGPTGSGKTTTLYASLNELNRPERKILTVEDPVEYMIDGINQVQVDPQIKLTFASALRAFLRQDPDIILVGEIRDGETADIAVQAALTGHLVLSTLHTNDAVSSITRLVDMGVEPFLLSSTLRGVMAQRLVRVLCPNCKRLEEVPSEVIDRYGLSQLASSPQLYQPVGCAECGGSGFKGRTAILEVLRITPNLQTAITDGMSAQELLRLAKGGGFRDMLADGLQKVLDGITALEEVLRVTRDGA